VAAGQERGEDAVDDLDLSDDSLRHLRPERIDRLGQALELLDVVGLAGCGRRSLKGSSHGREARGEAGSERVARLRYPPYVLRDRGVAYAGASDIYFLPSV
jgi:hypothetical protein